MPPMHHGMWGQCPAQHRCLHRLDYRAAACPRTVRRGLAQHHRPIPIASGLDTSTISPQQSSWASSWEQRDRQPQQGDPQGNQGSRGDYQAAPREFDRHRRSDGPSGWQGSQGRSSGGRGGGGRGGGRGRGSFQRGGRQGHNTDSAPPPPYKMVLRRQGILPSHVVPQDLQLPTGLAITWLGTSSGNPTLERNVSCTVVRSAGPGGGTVLVDCGEGSHRQLPAIGFDLSQVTNIYITHLHGDHCYGLGSALQAIDRAKTAAAAAAASAADQPAESASSQQGGSQGQANMTTYVWGPPGLAELLHAQLVITGAHTSLITTTVVTEFVVDEADAMLSPRPLVQGCDRLVMRRQAPRLVAQSAQLQAAAQSVQRALSAIPQVWSPRPGQGDRRGPGRLQDATRIGNDTISDDDAELLYGGRNYVAQEGLVWDLTPPGAQGGAAAGAMRCLAAQLQHRVPCWGYVMQEMSAPAPGSKRRKVVILGDTINSRAIAPLALGCDVLAHEATFIEGMEDKCRVAQHSTAWMAGAFAHAIQAQLLVLTHFSARYHRTGEPLRPRGGGRGMVMREREVSAEEEAQEQAQAIHRLIDEAQAQHLRGRVVAASDFFTVNVPVVAAPPNKA